MQVRCYGHIDPAVNYFHAGYTVPHEIDESQAIALLEAMSEGWSEERCCLLEALTTLGEQA